jgi:hypothetical protein
MWTRSARFLAAGLLSALALSGCAGDDDGDDTATDPGDGGTTTSAPSPEADAGEYPEFEPEDYSYTLRVSCFCPDAGVPMRITVTDGEVSESVYARSGRGFDKGSAAPDHWAITMNEVIAAANDTDAETVRVDWPEGQDFPNEVYVDQDSRMVDEEIGYVIANVDAG